MKRLIFILFLAFCLYGNNAFAQENRYDESELLLCQNTQKKSSPTSVNFYSADSIMAWLSGKTFYSGSTGIKFSYNAVYLNGSAVTGAPVVKRFTRTTATIEAHSPYMGGRTMTFYLDAERGAVRQAEDTYYLKKK